MNVRLFFLMVLSGYAPVVASDNVVTNIRQIQPRLIGYGPATVWVDDYAAVRRGNLAALRTANLPATLALRNTVIEVTFNTADGALSVHDLRAGRRWAQKPFSGDCFVKDAGVEAGRLQCTLFHGGSGLELSATLQLDGERPELLLELSAQGELPASLRFPHPFVGEPGDYLVVPMNEGIPACSKPWRKSGSSIRTWTCSSAR
jgi:hypothetical protein